MAKKVTIEEIQKVAVDRGGLCLSEEYKNGFTPLRWQCAKGHQWEAAPNKVKHDRTWCPMCSKRPTYTLEDMQAAARSRGGECLSKKYKGGGKKLTWKCADGHIWEATAQSIRQGSWCHKCSGNQPYILADLQAYAEQRNGKCLALEYKNVKEPLEWQCADGHRWFATFDNIKNGGKWCPHCSSEIHLREEICRAVFEQIFQHSFPTVRPPWLVNEEGNRLELDGYCEELAIAFEHQGRQHFEEIEWFGTSIKKLQKHDKLKVEICEERKVDLLIINYDDDLKDLVSLVWRRLSPDKRGLGRFGFEPDLSEIASQKTALNRLRAKAKERNGRCLSRIYLGMSSPINWQCEFGHTWSAVAGSVLHQETWCPHCDHRRQPVTIEKAINLAEARGGKCLSDSINGAQSRMEWECANGHIWQTTYASVSSGTWCPLCAPNSPKTIDDMIVMAERRKGSCLSSEYLGAHKKLKWRCEHGHEWEATPNSLSAASSWCPVCGGSQPKNLKDMHALARNKQGKCLSRKYKNMHTPLLWQCKKGHQWTAVPASIKAGTWCPRCAGNIKKTIRDMQALAAANDGACLSSEYLGMHKELRWQCSVGHEWEATPNSIQHDRTWCRECRNPKA